MVSAPTPIADGTLLETPLEHVFLAIERRALTGTLALWPDDASAGEDRLRFAEGRLTALKLRAPSPSLDPALVALFARTKAPYAFYERDLVGEGPGVMHGTKPTAAIVAAGVRAYPRAEIIARVLAAHGGAPLGVRAGAELSSLGLTPPELAVAQTLTRTPASRASLHPPPSDPACVDRTLYVLTITGRIEATLRPSTPRPSTRPPRASVPPPPAPPAAPADLPPALHERWAELSAFIVAADGFSAFELLGVGEAASNDEVTAAYAARARSVHPDRLEPALAPLLPFCQRVFHQITEAKATLLDPEQRLAHLKSVRAGGGTAARDRELAAIVGAAMEFRKTDVLVKQRRFAEALALLDDILAIDPGEPDYLARKAWVLLLQDEQLSAARVSAIISLCETALAKSERHEQAHYVLGAVQKRLGKLPEALAHFARVLEVNPGNIDAARELRVAEMRSRTSHPPASPSLLGKLFGGPKK